MQLDKILHAFAGYSVFLTTIPFGLEWAAGATLVAAVGKEIYDKYFGGTVDHYDAVATVGGGGAAFVISKILESI